MRCLRLRVAGSCPTLQAAAPADCSKLLLPVDARWTCRLLDCIHGVLKGQSVLHMRMCLARGQVELTSTLRDLRRTMHGAPPARDARSPRPTCSRWSRPHASHGLSSQPCSVPSRLMPPCWADRGHEVIGSRIFAYIARLVPPAGRSTLTHFRPVSIKLGRRWSHIFRFWVIFCRRSGRMRSAATTSECPVSPCARGQVRCSIPRYSATPRRHLDPNLTDSGPNLADRRTSRALWPKSLQIRPT